MSGEVRGDVAGRGAAERWWREWMKGPITVLWMALFGAAVLAGGMMIWQRTDLPLGVLPEFGISGEVRGVAPFGAEAVASGVRPGDKIVAVDGVPPEEAALPPVGTAVRFTLRSADGTQSEHVLVRDPETAQQLFSRAGLTAEAMAWFLAIVGALGDGLLVLAAVQLFRRGRWKLVPILLSFAFLAIGLTLLNGLLANQLGLSLWRMRIMMPAWTLFILAILLFPVGRFAWRWQCWFAAVLGVATAAIVVAPPEWWGPWSVVHTLALVAAALSLGFRYRAMPPGIERQQLRWALFGFMAGSLALVPAIYLDLFVIPVGLATPVFVWGVLAEQTSLALVVVLIVGGLLISLVKYRLYDADAVISRSVSIGALTLALLAVFTGTEKVIELLGEEWFGEKLGVLAGGIGAAVAALMIVPLHYRLTHWAEHKFQKQLIRLRHGLPLLVGDMRETAPVARIAAATLDSVVHGVRASRLALLFEGALLDARGIEADRVEAWRKDWNPPPHDGFDIDKADPLFPLRVPLAADGHGRIGWLLLGPRPDGSLYGNDERETLAEIADPVARALEIAAAREKREAEENQRWRVQESLNAEIRRVNSELVRVLGSLDAKLSLLVPVQPAAAAE